LEKKRLLFFDHPLGFPIDDDATKAHFLDDNNIDDVEELKDDKIIQLSLLLTSSRLSRRTLST
jgi:hypothetical protein